MRRGGPGESADLPKRNSLSALPGITLYHMTGFHCPSCGEYHNELPLVFGPNAPDSWHATPAAERTDDSMLTSDVCKLGDEHYFVRGCLDLPIRDSAEVFRWLVWVSVAESSFNHITASWEREGRESDPPVFGWLNTDLPGYPSTFNLKVNLHTRPVGERPLVEVEPTDHPLAVEQREGVSWSEVYVRVGVLLHGPRSL